MSIRAMLNSESIHSFNYDSDTWDLLKKTYKNLDLSMPCCGVSAIPKTSKLNNYFFAHKKQGECVTAPETAEHLYLKTLISKIALSEGWEVTTEKQGQTPTGELWIADIYCTKGNAKLAFEVQWSSQTNDEFIRRTQKYIDSGVRVLWLYRLKGNKTNFLHDLPFSKDVPVFGIKHNKESNLFKVSQFDVLVDKFIQGALKGNLQWLPKSNDIFTVKLMCDSVICWRCKQKTTTINALHLFNKDNIFIPSVPLSDSSEYELILKNFSNNELVKFNIGTIKSRYSKTCGYSYLSNGCVHCDALMGDFFLERDELFSPSETLQFSLPLHIASTFFDIYSSWYFQGLSSEYYG